MIKGKPYHKKFNVKYFIGLLIFGVIFLMLAWVYFHYSYLMIFIVNNRSLKTKCTLLTLPADENKDVLLDIDVTREFNTYKINKLTYIINKDHKTRVEILNFKDTDWVRLYFEKEKYAQVRYLFRALNQKDLQDCQLFKELIFLTGIVPTKIIYYIHNGQLINTAYRDFSQKDAIYTYNINIKDFMFIKNVMFNNRADDKADTSIKYIKPKTEKALLEDGTYVNAFSFPNIFPLIQHIIKSSKIEAEAVSVEVYNATDKSGYATFWSKVLKGVGFNVTRVGTAIDSPNLSGNSNNYTYWVYASNFARKTYSFKYIVQLLGERNMYISSVRPDSMITTGDIVIILLQ